MLKLLKIAVVDDDQVFHFIINRSLTKLYPGSKIQSFSNCADAFNFLKRNHGDTSLIPDIILLDLNTPFMNGWEFLDCYEALETQLLKRPEIYMISSSIDPHDVEKAQYFNSVSAFFSKPLAPEQLRVIIESALAR